MRTSVLRLFIRVMWKVARTQWSYRKSYGILAALLFLTNVVIIYKYPRGRTSSSSTGPVSNEKKLKNEIAKLVENERKAVQSGEAVNSMVVEDDGIERTIMYMEGWIDEIWFYDADIAIYFNEYSQEVCGYRCRFFKVEETNIRHMDMLVFQPSSLNQDPPPKPDHQYWIVNSFYDLDNSEVANFEKFEYADYIDDVIILPLTSELDLTFIPSARRTYYQDDKHLKAYQYKRQSTDVRALVVVQLTTICDFNEDTDILTDTSFLGVQLKNQPGFEVHYAPFCFGQDDGERITNEHAWFYIIDHETCDSVIIDQLIAVLKSDVNAIPVLPEKALSLQQLQKITPPHSYITVKSHSNITSTINLLRRISSQKHLYEKYISWKIKYTVGISAFDWRAESIEEAWVMSRMCAMCQRAVEKPKRDYVLQDETCYI